MKIKHLSVLSAVLVLALVLSACQAAAPTADPTAQPTAVEETEDEQMNTEEPSETEPPEATQTPEEDTEQVAAAVIVRDQDVIDWTVVVPEAEISTPGWLVIHADQDGSPGPVLGYAPLEEGVNQEVLVEVDQEQITPTLYAMLHEDTGEAGVYDFPDADPPVRVNGSVVVKPFQVEFEEFVSQEVTIEVLDSAYDPGEITIEPGTTVVWAQTGSLPHTVTADNGTFDSGDMASGDTFTFTFNEEGTYPYYCEYHGGPGGQGMSGVIIVGEGGGEMNGMDAEPTAAPEDEADSLY